MNSLQSPRPDANRGGQQGWTSIPPNGPDGRATAERGDPQRLRGTAFGLLMLLLVQFALGMVVNLYVHVPAGRAGYGAAVPALVLHGLVGLTLVIGSLSLAVRAVARRARPVTGPSVIAAAALLVAATGGLTFLGTGVSGASLVMALCAAIAICCYSVILYRVPGPLPGPAPQPRR